jgi:hypothetical protein
MNLICLISVGWDILGDRKFLHKSKCGGAMMRNPEKHGIKN